MELQLREFDDPEMMLLGKALVRYGKEEADDQELVNCYMLYYSIPKDDTISNFISKLSPTFSGLIKECLERYNSELVEWFN